MQLNYQDTNIQLGKSTDKILGSPPIGNNGVYVVDGSQVNCRNTPKLGMIGNHDQLSPCFQDGAIGDRFGEIIVSQSAIDADRPCADENLIDLNFRQGLLGKMTDQ